MKYTIGRSVLPTLLFALVALTANAAPEHWAGNGHYYEVIAADGIEWPDAKYAAELSTFNLDSKGFRGYLATITLGPEDEFLSDLRADDPGINKSGTFPNSELWVGGFQNVPAAPGANWFWVNGEGAFSYANWLTGEPNDSGGNERYLAIGWGNLFGWNDEAHLDGIYGYVVEYEVAVEAVDDEFDATSGVPIELDVLANDDISTSDIVSISIEADPVAAGIVDIGDGPDFLLTYTAPSDFAALDTFKYRVEHESGAFAIATVTVDVFAGQAVVTAGDDKLIFNQAQDPAPGSNNPLTAAYQQVLGAGGEVTISCCRVLDTREEGGKRGKYLAKEFDLGMALDHSQNPTCADMPHVNPGTAVLRPWQRGVPISRGIIDVYNPPPSDVREYDLGVCVIEAEVESRGVVFSAEEAKNVLGYSLNGAVETLRYRPFTGGVSITPDEVDAPYLVPWTAEWDESRSGKRYSTNLMVVNLWHEWLLMPSVPYLLELAARLDQSINQVNSTCPVANTNGFLNTLRSRVRSAQWDILVAALPWRRTLSGQKAVDTLNDATRLALLIEDGAVDAYGDPYASCLDNPEGLFVGRLMSLKFATCSELVHPFSSSSSLDGACMIEEDILCELPELPGFSHPSCSP